MSDDDVISDVVRELQMDIEDDYVGLWEVPRHLHQRVRDTDEVEIRRLAEQVIRRLVVDVGWRVGEIFGRPGFTPWEGDDVVERVMKAWDELGREPNLYEICWFDLPEA
jgi:hypothetical protein